MRSLLISTASVLIALSTAGQAKVHKGTHSKADTVDTCRCAQSLLEIRASAIETIFLRPDEILADVKAFWQKNDTYQWVKSWHDYNKIPVDYDEWKETMKQIAGYPLEARRKSKAMRIVEDLTALNEKFAREAVSHICSFLPIRKERLDTTIRLATYTYPRAFTVGDNIVMDVMNTYYNYDPNHIMNTILHEVFHIGYGRNHLHRQGVWLEPYSLYMLVQNLQNEGMATYCAYTARSIFPVENDRDYAMLENPSEVEKALKRVNRLFEQARSLTAEELQSRAFEVGVEQRTYYVAGSYMAQTIDKTLGRAVLARTVIEGPRSFIGTYNSLVEEPLRVVSFEMPDRISPLQDLRLAALQGDYEGFLAKLEEIAPQDIGSIEFAEHIMYNTGYMLRSDGKPELAIRLFEFCIRCCPGKPYQYKWLAQALNDDGRKAEAIEAYKRVLAADPYDVGAREAVANLEKGR